MSFSVNRADRVIQLTPRELEVLRLIARGYSTKEIAYALKIAPKTAACHRMRVMDKLNIHDVAGLTRYAVRTGLIDIYGEAGGGKTMEALAADVEAAHQEYHRAMQAYQVFLVERQDLEPANPDGRVGAARLHHAEMVAHRKYHSALLALKDFLTGTRPRRELTDAGVNQGF